MRESHFEKGAHMTKRFVLVAGNIGSGKTTLTGKIGECLGWKTAYESVVDNPYLPHFYADMKSWSFHLQIYFLGHRAQQHLEMWEDSQSVIIDRSIYEDAYIFARALNHMHNLTDLDYQSYLRVFDILVKSLPSPALLVYLKAPVPVLMERIRKRARNMETGITADYLSLLDSYYNEWMTTFDACPVLTLHTDDLDYVHKPDHLELVVQRIQEKLAGKEDLIF
jgi:deoxyadenosine/deoxycytidine kinase